MQFQISYRRENGKKIPESSRLEFLEKFSPNDFALSDAEDNTSGLQDHQVQQFHQNRLGSPYERHLSLQRTKH